MFWKIISRFSLLLLLPFVVGMVNYWVDRDQILRDDTVVEMVNAIQAGNNICGVEYIDDRTFQKLLIQQQNETPDVLILGSSRTLGIDKSCFPNQSFFNHSVTNANLEDFLAIVHLYEEVQSLPDTILLGLDQWLLNDAIQRTNWMPLSTDYLNMNEQLGFSYDWSIWATRWNYYKNYWSELFSTVSFLNGIQKPTSQKWEITTSSECEKDIKFADGSRRRNVSHIHRGKSHVERTAKDYVIQSKDEQFNQLSANKKKQLEQLIFYLKQKGVHLILYIPPYHPITYEGFMNHPSFKGMPLATLFYQELAKKYKLQVIGASNPKTIGANFDHFYDATHLQNWALNPIIQRGIKKE